MYTEQLKKAVCLKLCIKLLASNTYNYKCSVMCVYVVCACVCVHAYPCVCVRASMFVWNCNLLYSTLSYSYNFFTAALCCELQKTHSNK